MKKSAPAAIIGVGWGMIATSLGCSFIAGLFISVGGCLFTIGILEYIECVIKGVE